ncbi:MAG: conjugal transfer protein TrbC [Alteromonadaceae bacterium]|nr:conjugal transfer protein TrbC [Alteromonadaceae bacterium]
MFASADALSEKVTKAQEKEKNVKNNVKLQQMIVEAKKRGRDHKSMSSISTYLNSKAFAVKQKKYTDSMRALMGLNKEDGFASENKEKQIEMGDRVVLFVSSSMPQSVLRTYARDLSKINGVMILRGFIGGISKMMPTKNWIRKLIVVNKNCDSVGCETINLNVAFDPDRFTQNGIDKVPALIYEKNMDLSAYCKKSDKNKAKFVVYGDASLKGMLLELNRKLNDANIAAMTRKM